MAYTVGIGGGQNTANLSPKLADAVYAKRQLVTTQNHGDPEMVEFDRVLMLADPSDAEVGRAKWTAARNQWTHTNLYDRFEAIRTGKLVP